jgi:hypothetical protein
VLKIPGLDLKYDTTVSELYLHFQVYFLLPIVQKLELWVRNPTIKRMHVKTPSVFLLSRVRDSVTNNNGFWIGWMDLLALLLQSLLVTTTYNCSNQWLPKTRAIPYWTTRVFFSAVTDLVPIYESVTSLASVVHWLTLHSWKIHYWTAFWILLRMNWSRRRFLQGEIFPLHFGLVDPCDCPKWTLESITCPPFITSGRAEKRSNISSIIWYLSTATKLVSIS